MRFNFISRFVRAGVVSAAIATLSLLVATGCSRSTSSKAEINENISMKTVLIPIEGMSCSACVARIKKEIKAKDGVHDIEVSLEQRNARIGFDVERQTAANLAKEIQRLGYRAGVPVETK